MEIERDKIGNVISVITDVSEIKFSIGDTVNYHEKMGGKIVSKDHEIECFKVESDISGNPVVRVLLTKQLSTVSIDCISLQAKRIINPKTKPKTLDEFIKQLNSTDVQALKPLTDCVEKFLSMDIEQSMSVALRIWKHVSPFIGIAMAQSVMEKMRKDNGYTK